MNRLLLFLAGFCIWDKYNDVTEFHNTWEKWWSEIWERVHPKKQWKEDFSFHHFCFNDFTHRLERAAGSTVTVSSDLLHYTSHWTEQIDLCSWPLTCVEFVWNPNSFRASVLHLFHNFWEDIQGCVGFSLRWKPLQCFSIISEEKHFGFSSRVVRAFRVWPMPWILTLSNFFFLFLTTKGACGDKHF